MNDKQLEKKYGVTAEQIAEWSEAAERGEYPGIPKGEVMVGRPLKFGEELRPVTFKEPQTIIAAIDARARSQGVSRSDYLRDLVEKDLAEIT
jgi:hypothetical protein